MANRLSALITRAGMNPDLFEVKELYRSATISGTKYMDEMRCELLYVTIYIDLYTVLSTSMRWILFCLLLFTLPAGAIELFRDDHPRRSYVFESDAKEVTATINRDDVIKKANEWAARFYNDPFI
jgi:hypothetical protein